MSSRIASLLRWQAERAVLHSALLAFVVAVLIPLIGWAVFGIEPSALRLVATFAVIWFLAWTAVRNGNPWEHVR